VWVAIATAGVTEEWNNLTPMAVAVAVAVAASVAIVVTVSRVVVDPNDLGIATDRRTLLKRLVEYLHFSVAVSFKG
jgi:hypothetical protein